jgi:hypothetical protein
MEQGTFEIKIALGWFMVRELMWRVVIRTDGLAVA